MERKILAALKNKTVQIGQSGPCPGNAVSVLRKRPYWLRIWVAEDVMHGYGKERTVPCSGKRFHSQINDETFRKPRKIEEEATLCILPMIKQP
jgi:hypothetical protein